MNSRALAIPAYLCLCLILGGATLAGYTANLALQLLALPLLLFAFLSVRPTPLSLAARLLIALTVILVGVLALHLVPLPPSIWSSLPGRQPVADGYSMLGLPLPWLPLSLAPDVALTSLIWMLPAIAILLGILLAGAYKARWLAWAIVLTALLSIVIAAGQRADATSPLYFYQVTNRGFGVGFFANANHQATLMLCTLAFLAALLVDASGQSGGSRKRGHSGKVLACVGAFLVLAIGLAVNGSLAGLGLGVPVAAASLLLAPSIRKRINPWIAGGIVAIVGAASIFVVFAGPLGNNLTGDAASSSESRAVSITTTAEAAVDYLPLGSGLATFPQVYRTYENPSEATATWMNHAHSDYAELLLELGIPGVVLVLMFLLWWVWRTIAIWAGDEDVFARAATIASGAILAHSLVDYPLRTAAIGAVFAVCCALMAQPSERGRRRRKSEREASGARHLTA